MRISEQLLRRCHFDNLLRLARFLKLETVGRKIEDLVQEIALWINR